MTRTSARPARLVLCAGGVAVAVALTTGAVPALAQEAPTPTASPTADPTATPDPTATATPSATATPGPTATATPSATATSGPTATPGPTATASPAPTAPLLRLGLSSRLVRGDRTLRVSARAYRDGGAAVRGLALDVLGRTPGTTGWLTLGRAVTDDAGLAALVLVPRVSREYRVRTATGPSASTAVGTVAVQPVLSGGLTPRVTELRRSGVLTGRLTPAYQGTRVLVQRRLADGWRTVSAVGTGADGTYRWAVTPGATGRFVFRAVLPAAPAHLAAASPATDLVVEGRTLREGDRGGDVTLLQQRLRAVSADVGPVDGVFGYDLRHAVTAFQKAQDLPRTGVYDTATSTRLAAPRAVALRYPAQGRAVEVDLTRQVLYVSEAGRLTRIVDVSTGSDELYESEGVTSRAFTPIGRFAVERKIDKLHESPLGLLYRPAFFTRGWAVHGSPSVPIYPASHGCVRVTDPAMDRLYDLLTIGVPVSVYRS